jgi:hypothetical protein
MTILLNPRTLVWWGQNNKPHSAGLAERFFNEKNKLAVYRASAR